MLTKKEKDINIAVKEFLSVGNHLDKSSKKRLSRGKYLEFRLCHFLVLVTFKFNFKINKQNFYYIKKKRYFRRLSIKCLNKMTQYQEVIRNEINTDLENLGKELEKKEERLNEKNKLSDL